jgi:hypothetical protein
MMFCSAVQRTATRNGVPRRLSRTIKDDRVLEIWGDIAFEPAEQLVDGAGLIRLRRDRPPR